MNGLAEKKMIQSQGEIFISSIGCFCGVILTGWKMRA